MRQKRYNRKNSCLGGIFAALLEQFANVKYKLLQFLRKHQVNPAGHFYIPLSQQEIADGIRFSKAKTNGLMKELKELDCIRAYRGKNGKYQITEQGNAVLGTIGEGLYEK